MRFSVPALRPASWGPRERLPRPTRTATSLAVDTSCDLRCAAPGHCASCSLRDFYVHSTRWATRDAHAGTRMALAMVRCCWRCRTGVVYAPCQQGCAAPWPCILHRDAGVTRSVKMWTADFDMVGTDDAPMFLIQTVCNDVWTINQVADSRRTLTWWGCNAIFTKATVCCTVCYPCLLSKYLHRGDARHVP